MHKRRYGTRAAVPVETEHSLIRRRPLSAPRHPPSVLRQRGISAQDDGQCIAFHRGRTTMVWQTQVRTEAGKLCAVVTQTQLVMGPAAS